MIRTGQSWKPYLWFDIEDRRALALQVSEDQATPVNGQLGDFVEIVLLVKPEGNFEWRHATGDLRGLLDSGGQARFDCHVELRRIGGTLEVLYQGRVFGSVPYKTFTEGLTELRESTDAWILGKGTTGRQIGQP